MDFSEYQGKAGTTAIYPKQLEGGVYYAAIGLAGEVGELLNKIKKIARDNAPVDKDAIAGELGDILWYVSQVATEFGIGLNDVAKKNLEKLSDRKQRGKISGSGDYR
ncbi:MAG: nucleoside triphosphate pyrophosphohydrolase family protein [Candidatus Micrarchaeaceae archaeon]